MTRTRATVTLLAALACVAGLGCRRQARDVRVPLGARVAGVSHPVLASRGIPPSAIVRTTASLPPASYAAEQAARGAQLYVATCVRCHPPGQLDGEAFAVGWADARVSTLFSLVRNTMPQDKPGSLTDDQYADVIAYLLQRNRVAPGAAPLTPDTAALRAVRIAIAR